MTIIMKLKGRLGNQLFQYATIRAISLEKKLDMHINTKTAWDNQGCLLDNFKIYNNPDYDYVTQIFQEGNGNPSHYMYDENIKHIQNNTVLSGNFQNIKYFEKYISQIKTELKFKDDTVNELAVNYINDLKKKTGKDEIVSINIRRGDFVKWGVFDEEYVKKFIDIALSKITNIADKIILIFIGGSLHNDSTDDINWVKNNIKYDNIFISKYSIDYSPHSIIYDMAISQLCDYMVIPIMSTINWWILCLNNNNSENNYVPFKSWTGDEHPYDDNYNIIDIPMNLNIAGVEVPEIPNAHNIKLHA